MRMQPWKTVNRQVTQTFGKFLTVEVHEIELPDGRRIQNWPWLVAPDFAVVMAQTEDGRFLFFRQTKYAVKGITLAPVGGHVDEGEKPLAAAKRELLEETGYAAPKWISLGTYAGHANRGGGHGHFFLALNARHKCAPHADDLEEQELLFLTRPEIEAALNQQKFKVVSWVTLIILALRQLDRRPACSKPASSTRKSIRS